MARLSVPMVECFTLMASAIAPTGFVFLPDGTTINPDGSVISLEGATVVPDTTTTQ